jgi:hypothetical protein
MALKKRNREIYWPYEGDEDVLENAEWSTDEKKWKPVHAPRDKKTKYKPKIF